MPGTIAAVALAYALGCANAAYYVVRWRDGRDIRTLGSGTAGARNAGRVLGRWAFALVFLLDAAKGGLVVLGARWWVPEAAPLCAMAAVIGHVWPAQLGWRGGKGVATAIGVLAALDVAVLAAVVVVFALLRPLVRCTTPAGIVAFWCATVVAFSLRPLAPALVTLTIAALLTFTHRNDLRLSWLRT
jgi:glycerol-3-phosphate acyltransferase PlsY